MLVPVVDIFEAAGLRAAAESAMAAKEQEELARLRRKAESRRRELEHARVLAEKKAKLKADAEMQAKMAEMEAKHQAEIERVRAEQEAEARRVQAQQEAEAKRVQEQQEEDANKQRQMEEVGTQRTMNTVRSPSIRCHCSHRRICLVSPLCLRIAPPPLLCKPNWMPAVRTTKPR